MTTTGKLGVFAITFGLAYSVIYVICTEVNLPVFSYHPATGEFGWLSEAPRRGPVMYWYGWMLTSLIGAVALAGIAMLLPERWLQRAIMTGAIFAVLYLVIYTLALFIYDRATVELEFLKERAWSVAAALAIAAVAVLLAPAAWVRRLWPGWMWAVPLGAIAVLVYYLTPYFTR
jgi:hypothetical protein